MSEGLKFVLAVLAFVLAVIVVAAAASALSNGPPARPTPPTGCVYHDGAQAVVRTNGFPSQVVCRDGFVVVLP